MLAALSLLAGCNGGPEVLSPPDGGGNTPGFALDAEPVGPDPAVVQAYQDALFDHPQVRARFGEHRSGVLDFQIAWEEDEAGELAPSSRYRAVVYDYDVNEAWSIEGDVNEVGGQLNMAITAERPRPTPQEFEIGVELLLEQDERVAAEYAAGSIEFYRPMPGLGHNDDGDRIIHVGIRRSDDDGSSSEGREIGGANLSVGTIIHYQGGTPVETGIDGFFCNPPPTAWQYAPFNQQGWARVKVKADGAELWKFIVQRPSASSGRDGSAIELADVRYKGKRMLYQAHLPILNVFYEGNFCGPYRDWQDQENAFMIGDELKTVANGIKIVEWSKTILQLNDDFGNFNGVAISWDEAHQQVVLISELEAGWYRYVSEWRFAPDGTITSRFGFGAVENSCTCHPHTHNSYHRFDVDLGDGRNRVESFDSAAGWQAITTEVQQLRSEELGRKWRVTDPATGDSVVFTPGAGEDPADYLSHADLWALVSHPDELDDSRVRPPYVADCGLPDFVNGESTVDADLVIWGAGHFYHDDTDPTGNQTHETSWTIAPESW